ncbi:MAG: hypothetical protein IJD60_04795, partial [Clostridia bacterium]|nr:hypothetical protein [Clostridia bacterium]
SFIIILDIPAFLNPIFDKRRLRSYFYLFSCPFPSMRISFSVFPHEPQPIPSACQEAANAARASTGFHMLNQKASREA